MKYLRHEYLAAAAILTIFAVLADCSPAAQHPISISRTDQGFVIAESGEKILLYQRQHKSLDGKYSRANYIHPLYSLDGEILTEDFPVDHRHHRGVFWAWHQVWIGDTKVGDPWATKDFFWDVYDAKIMTVDAQSRALQVHVYWKSPLHTDSTGKQLPFIKEKTTITARRVKDNMRRIDFQIELLAIENDVRLGGSEDAKGYGGFTTRIRLPEGLAFTCRSGPVKPTTLSVEAGPWLDFSGNFGKTGKTSGLAILCHKSSPGYPQPWILRRNRSAQNPVYPGQEAVPISRTNPLVLRYRLIIHRGDANNLELDKLQAEYNTEPTS